MHGGGGEQRGDEARRRDKLIRLNFLVGSMKMDSRRSCGSTFLCLHLKLHNQLK